MAMSVHTVDSAEVGGRRVVIRPTGDVGEGAALALADQLRGAQSQGMPVVLDLRRVESLTDVAVRAIGDADLRARDRGARLRMIPGLARVQGSLRAAGLEERLLAVTPEMQLS
jgi:anti-sigma B factor antagonist